ncbi:MAG: hypothetical protein WCG25_05920 [bacterium]
MHIAHGPIQTFTPSAHAKIRSRVASSVITFHAITVILFPYIDLIFFIFSIIDFW